MFVMLLLILSPRWGGRCEVEYLRGLIITISFAENLELFWGYFHECVNMHLVL